jgi:hypothetical protein
MPFRAPTSFHDTSGTKKYKENCITTVQEYKIREDAYFIKNQCCESGMFIPDPTTAPKEEKIFFLCRTIFGSHKYHRLYIVYF